MTSDGTNYYVLKTDARMKSITSGSTLATDAWGASGIAALYDNLGATAQALIARNAAVRFGNAANQVLSPDLSGAGWAMTGAGIPLAAGVSTGSTLFGNDYFNDYRPNQMCSIGGGGTSD